jgi:alpha-glucosidase
VRAPEPTSGAYRHAELDVSWLDFTNPAAVAWWQAGVHRALVDLDLDGGMVDFGDVVPADAVFADGRTGAQAHNDVPTLYHRALCEEAHRSKPDSVFWMRSGAAGGQRFHDGTWSGDPIDCWAPVTGLASLVPAALSAGLSGYPYWHTEVGGYVQAQPPLPRAEEQELWLRWLQLGAFTAMLRDQYGEKPGAAVDAWTDAETLGEYVRYAAIHHRLLPYLYSLAREANETGMPLIRHLALAYPDDPLAWAVEDAYLLGPDLLVAPIVEPGAAGRAVYLPRGEWVDFWSGECRQGGAMSFVAAGRHTIPVFVRAGAALPLLPENSGGAPSPVPPEWDAALVLQVQPASDATRLEGYLFDGARVTSEVGPTEAAVTVSGGRARTYEVRLPLGGAVRVVEGRRLEAARAGTTREGAVRVFGASLSVVVAREE